MGLDVLSESNYDLDPLPSVTRTIEPQIGVQILVVCIGGILQWEGSVWVISHHRDGIHLTSNDLRPRFKGHSRGPVLTRKRAPLGLTFHLARPRPRSHPISTHYRQHRRDGWRHLQLEQEESQERLGCTRDADIKSVVVREKVARLTL